MELLSKAAAAALLQRAQETSGSVEDRRYTVVAHEGNRHERRKAKALARRKK